MKADFLRYQAEYAPDKDRKKFIDESKKSYESALEISLKEHDPASKEALGLILNYSVLMYGFLDQKVEAIHLIDKTFDQVQKLVYDNPSKYVSSRPYLQMLRDNSSLWRHETDIKEDPNKTENEDQNEKQSEENKTEKTELNNEIEESKDISAEDVMNKEKLNFFFFNL